MSRAGAFLTKPGDLVWENDVEHAGITAQAVNLAATAAVDPAALGKPGVPVPDDKTAVPMFVAHRLDDTLRGLAHGTERMQASRGAAGDLRGYHCAHLLRHLHQALDNLHGVTACVKEHFPAEAAELEQIRQDVGLAKALSPQAKIATTAHLLETTLHEAAHAKRHAEQMSGPGGPDDLWAFNAEHCAKHLAGAVEHAKKLAQHFTDNYPAVGRWLTELSQLASPSPGGGQHARYGTVTAQLAAPVTVSGQARLIDLRGWEGWREEPRDSDGRWTRGAAAVLEKVTEPIRGEGARGNSRPVSDELTASLTALRPEFARLDHLSWYEAMMTRLKGIDPAAGFTTITGQALDLSWRDAWRTELRGPHGEWVKGQSEALSLHKLVRGAADPFVGPELPDTLSRAERTAVAARVGKFLNIAGPKVPAMISPDGHLDYDGKPPTLFNENDRANAGLLAEIDWYGHMRMSNQAAQDIQNVLDHPDQPVNDPGALIVPLHEFIHATVPAGEHRDSNGDKAAYQDFAHADIEEGFTQLGAIQHAAGFFQKTGLADLHTPVIDDDTQRPLTMADYAQRAAGLDHIRNGIGWGSYKDLTAQALDWVSLIAQQNTGKPESDPATGREIQRLSDQVNAVGTAAKPRVMAQHAVADMLTGLPSDQDVIGSAEQSILDNWGNIGGTGALNADIMIKQARQAAQQRLQALQAERGAA